MDIFGNIYHFVLNVLQNAEFLRLKKTKIDAKKIIKF